MAARQFLCSVALYSAWLRCAASWAVKEEVMKTLSKILLALTAVAALSIAYPASVQAVPTTYHYTGHHFTEADGPYTTSMFVTAMVTLAGPLGANMPLTEVTPTAFTLFDGVQTISNTTPDLATQVFRFATNACGEITFWEIGVYTFLVHYIGTIHDGVVHSVDAGGTGRAFAGRSIDTPGVWSQGIATPDAGSTLSLMTLTLIAFGLVARRFQRAAG